MPDEYGPERYESPTIGGERVEYVTEGPLDKLKAYIGPVAEAAREQGIPFIKENIRLIAAAVAAVIVVYLLYYFFVGSVRNIELGVVDTEGGAVGNATVKVFAPGSQQPLYEFKGSESIALRFGIYEVEVAATGFRKVEKAALEIGPESSQEEITIEKSIDVEIAVNEFPAKLYNGESRTLTIKITNRAQESATVELVLGGDLADDAAIEMAAANISAGSTNDVEFRISVKEDADEGTGRRGDIRVKGLLEKASVQYEVVAFRSSDIKISETSLDFGTLDAGEQAEKEINIRSEAKSPVENIEFGLINVSARNNSASEVESWFSFNPPALDSLEPGTAGKQKVAVIVEVPFDAQTDTIDGLVEIRTTFWSKTLNFDLDIKAVGPLLELTGLDNTYSISKEGTAYETKTDLLTLRNSGEVSVSSVKMESNCGAEWITTTPEEVSQIAAGQNATIVLSVTAPSTFLEDRTHACSFRVVYPDPRNPIAPPLEINRAVIINS